MNAIWTHEQYMAAAAMIARDWANGIPLDSKRLDFYMTASHAGDVVSGIVFDALMPVHREKIMREASAVRARSNEMMRKLEEQGYSAEPDAPAAAA